MIKQQRLVTGALLLTAAGFAGRLIGFFYKISSPMPSVRRVLGSTR